MRVGEQRFGDAVKAVLFRLAAVEIVQIKRHCFGLLVVPEAKKERPCDCDSHLGALIPVCVVELSDTNLPLKLDILSPRPPGGEIESGKEKCLVSMGYQYENAKKSPHSW